MEMIFTALAALVLGCGFGWALNLLRIRRLISSAQREAQDIIQESQDELDLIELDQKQQLQEIELELWTRDVEVLL
jgi:ribonuclease Y